MCKEIPLHVRLFVALTMHDYDNWNNGVYHGDYMLICKKIFDIISDVKLVMNENTINSENKSQWEKMGVMDEIQDWLNDGMPDKHRYENVTCENIMKWLHINIE